MFNDSYLRACMKLRIVQKIRFSLLESGRTKAWCPGFVSRPRAKAQELVARIRGLVIQPPKYSCFQQVRQPSIPSPVEEDTSKIWDTTGTVFIQGPSIVLPVWRCIMFNGSYLRVCMKLRIVQQIRFSIHESGWTKAWCPGLVSGPSAKAQELVARIRGLVIQPPKLSVGAYFELLFLGCGFLIHLSNRSDSPRFPDPTHQTRAPWLGPLRLKKAKSNFFHKL